MKTIRFVFLLLLFMGLSGCTISDPTSLVETPTITETKVSTNTPIPSKTFTLTPVVTYSPETQYANMIDMVNAENSGCTLPCWWGITPGETSGADSAEKINQAGLTAFENISEGLSSQGLKMYQIDGGDSDGFTRLYNDFYVHDELVSRIVIGDYGGTPDITFRSIWLALSPEAIIPKLGVPSRVLVTRQSVYQSAGGDVAGSTTGYIYSLHVFYDEIDVYLHYEMKTDALNSPFCPSFGENGNTTEWFKIILKSDADKTPIEKYDDGYYLNEAVYPGLTFESVTGKTLEDFYQAYLQTDSPPCFYVLPDVFEP